MAEENQRNPSSPTAQTRPRAIQPQVQVQACSASMSKDLSFESPKGAFDIQAKWKPPGHAGSEHPSQASCRKGNPRVGLSHLLLP